MTTISFKTTKEEFEAIGRIADRALRGVAMRTGRDDRMTLIMDISAVHANGCPLDLDGLAEADDFNFAHDVTGIQRHINRRTGELEDCFLPRYSKRPGLEAVS